MIVGIGVDVVEIYRIRKILETQGTRFTNRVFTEEEQAYCAAHRDPAPHYAARFAAKEAAMKALGTGWAEGIRWRDVEILPGAGGKPELVLHGQAAERARELRAVKHHVTITHSGLLAVAQVILEST